MTRADPIAPGRGDWKRHATFVVFFALFVQIVHFADSLNDPTAFVPIVDAGEYHRAAVRFARTGSLSDGPFWQPPLFPFVLGLLYGVVGENILAARLALVMIAVASCAMVWWLGRRLFSPATGVVGAVLLALNGPYLFYANQLMPVGLVVFLSLGALCVWFWGSGPIPRGRSVAFGVLVGLATITVPNAIVLLSLPWIQWAAGALRGNRRRDLALAGVCALLAAAMPVLVVTIRNYRVSGEWVPISTNGGINFFIGNNPNAERTLAVRPGEEWEQLTRESCADRPRTASEQSQFFAARAWEHARAAPGAFAAGLAGKAYQLVNGREIPRNEDLYTFRDYYRLLNVLVWRAGSVGFPWGVLFPLAVYSVIARRKENESAQESYGARAALIGFVVLYAGTVILFFVSARYRVPLIPIVCLFAADGVVRLVTGIRGGRRIGWGGVAAATSALVVCNLPVRAATDGVNFRAELHYFVGQALAERGAAADAEDQLKMAVELDPDFAAAHAARAYLLASTGNLDEALTAARLAVSLKRNSAEARSILADVLHRRNQLDEARRVYYEALTVDALSPEAHFGLAEVLHQSGRTEEAMEHFRRAVELSSDPGSWLVRLADLLVERGEYADALRLYERASRSENDPRVLNTLAWLLATCPRAELRNCEKATRIAERLCRQTGYQHPVALDTLAAAHADCGRIDQAILLVRKALEIASLSSDREAVAAFQNRLEVYETIQSRRGTGR